MAVSTAAGSEIEVAVMKDFLLVDVKDVSKVDKLAFEKVALKVCA